MVATVRSRLCRPALPMTPYLADAFFAQFLDTTL